MAKADIIEHNLELMLSEKIGGMMYRFSRESAGSRGPVFIEDVRYDTIFANFYYDGETGEILCFSNYEETLNDKPRGIFKIAIDARAKRIKNFNPFFKIVETRFDNKSSDEANAVIATCANIYNETYEKQ
jgi:hypothetical protein